MQLRLLDAAQCRGPTPALYYGQSITGGPECPRATRNARAASSQTWEMHMAGRPPPIEEHVRDLSGKRTRFWPRALAAVFGVAWLILAWKSLFPQDWALENVLSLGCAWWLVRHHRHAPLSDGAYTLLLMFGLAHELGAHFTYAEVPYDAWSRRVLGFSPDALFGFPRNEYDRLVHFSFGLLCFRPMREALGGSLPRPRSAALAFTATVMVTISALYELLEWAAALVFGGDLGQAYLGTQGDAWDAQKDMALALLGTLVALGCSWAAARPHSTGRRGSDLPQAP